MTTSLCLKPGDIKRLMSDKLADVPSKPKGKQEAKQHEIVIDGKTYRSVNTATIRYSVTNHINTRKKQLGLCDQGANGGIAGDDVIILSKTNRSVDVQGIDNHQVTDVSIVTSAGYTDTQRGPAILIMNQFASIGKGQSILSSPQMEHFGVEVDDRSSKVGGKQRLSTPDGWVIPMEIVNGLPYVRMRPPTKRELDTLPHIVLTSDKDWDPSVLDSKLEDFEKWAESIPDDGSEEGERPFDRVGILKSIRLSLLSRMNPYWTRLLISLNRLTTLHQLTDYTRDKPRDYYILTEVLYPGIDFMGMFKFATTRLYGSCTLFKLLLSIKATPAQADQASTAAKDRPLTPADDNSSEEEDDESQEGAGSLSGPFTKVTKKKVKKKKSLISDNLENHFLKDLSLAQRKLAEATDRKLKNDIDRHKAGPLFLMILPGEMEGSYIFVCRKKYGQLAQNVLRGIVPFLFHHLCKLTNMQADRVLGKWIPKSEIQATCRKCLVWCTNTLRAIEASDQLTKVEEALEFLDDVIKDTTDVYQGQLLIDMDMANAKDIDN
ncbi:unnamed protein product [Cylindrotheca closterium]|uniref:Uncharacterized protein n=1 Tax=Cylindrotheca closterium TaxID=2856 RepID=A0AAD2JM36_9STRA|nr:unnamed protein product [Cylindrotheca closterium]